MTLSVIGFRAGGDGMVQLWQLIPDEQQGHLIATNPSPTFKSTEVSVPGVDRLQDVLNANIVKKNLNRENMN